MQLYIAGDGDTVGPYSVNRVQDLATKGELTGEELPTATELGTMD